MADNSNPCSEATLADGIGGDGGILRAAGSGFPSLPLLLYCGSSVGPQSLCEQMSAI